MGSKVYILIGSKVVCQSSWISHMVWVRVLLMLKFGVMKPDNCGIKKIVGAKINSIKA